ncbi:hypothetical protein BX666DRAFT_2117360 [Dichotomocladium elegans]|nr:hypothetical protein BX666DRAFT_2117360 [Dichotomocladium elegans]
MIIDPMDPTPINDHYFTIAQMEIIQTYAVPTLPKLPAVLLDYVLSYKEKPTCPPTRKKLPPIKQADLRWAHKSIVDAMDLLIYNRLPDSTFSESDLLHDIWSLIKKCFANSVIDVNTHDIFVRLAKAAPSSIRDIKTFNSLVYIMDCPVDAACRITIDFPPDTGAILSEDGTAVILIWTPHVLLQPLRPC